MALPPTIIYRFLDDDPEVLWTNLRKAGLLKFRVNKAEFTKKIETAKKVHYANKSDMPGPNLDDIIAEKLNTFLNLTGKTALSLDERNYTGIKKLSFEFILFLHRIRGFFSR